MSAALLIGCPTEPGRPQPQTPPQARLRALKGEVRMKPARGDDWVVVREEVGLRENDKVRTAEGASAEIQFAPGLVVSVGGDALVGVPIQRPRPGEVRSDLTLHKGRVDARLEDSAGSSLTVSTPAATIRAGREIVFQ